MICKEKVQIEGALERREKVFQCKSICNAETDVESS